ncbi:MAG: acyl-CoA dehydrogenase family protein [Myxococcales bacterium]|nr:acyl-CoA dehydrogenase family protein [Myxococcales bacterium]
MSDEVAAFRSGIRGTVRRFVQREVVPHIDQWEEAGTFPRDLYARAGAVGLLGLGYPEELGGIPSDSQTMLVVTDELAKAGAGGLIAGLLSHGIALPPILALASDELAAEIAPKLLTGEHIAALCVTEPGGGSDVANLRTTARREGDVFVVNGTKTFITSGMRADWLTTAVRTGGEGASGVSVLAIPGILPGIGRTKLEKMGWWCSDTAHLTFDNVQVPARYLCGSEGMGFLGLMHNFNHERLMLAAMAVAFAEVCIEDALSWARDRETFGRPLIKRQVIRHKLLEMTVRTAAARALLEKTARAIDGGKEPVAEVCMLKTLATDTLEFVAGEAVQVLGGMGYMRGTRVERIFRESKVLAIGGGASEILRDLAARQLGW